MSSKYESCVGIDAISLLQHNYIIIMIDFYLDELSAKTLLNFLRCHSSQDHFKTIQTRLNIPISLCGVRAEWNITVSLRDIIKSNDRLDDCNTNTYKQKAPLFLEYKTWHTFLWTRYCSEQLQRKIFWNGFKYIWTPTC